MTSSFDPRKLFSVEGLVVLITGGGSGIGLMVAKALSANNAKVVYIVGRREASLKSAASQCPNPNVIPIVGDVTSKTSLSSIADRILADHGHLDVLFANAGIGGASPPPAPPLQGDNTSALMQWRDTLWSVPMEDFTQTLHINCTAVMYTVLAFLPLLLAGNEKRDKDPAARRQRSQIIVTASVASFSRTIAHNPAYPASKAAVMSLVKTLATKLGPEGVRVNALAPGLYVSEMTAGNDQIREGMRGDEEGALPKHITPEGRMGGEEDMAATALYMMGSGGAYLSGSVLLTDGGRLGLLPGTY